MLLRALEASPIPWTDQLPTQWTVDGSLALHGKYKNFASL